MQHYYKKLVRNIKIKLSSKLTISYLKWAPIKKGVHRICYIIETKVCIVRSTVHMSSQLVGLLCYIVLPGNGDLRQSVQPSFPVIITLD